MYWTLGYYICEKMKVPEYLGINSDWMISVSDCFGGIHPNLGCCFFTQAPIIGGLSAELTDAGHTSRGEVYSRERTKYREKWNIDSDKAAKLQDDIGKIFGSRIAVDGRFLRLADAEYFCETYFDYAQVHMRNFAALRHADRAGSSNKCMVVSVSTTEEYYHMLTSELADNSDCKNDIFGDPADAHELLGYDILGWDISGFHTFLCNGLQKDLRLAKFNNFCLLDNDFAEVAAFAREIQGKGEPVEWIPCRIGSCVPSAGLRERDACCCGQEVSR